MRVFPVLQRVETFSDARQEALLVPDARELRQRAFKALRTLLSRLSQQRKLVLYIDDLQWGDVDSAAALAELLRPPDPPRLMLLACYRSEGLQDNACIRTLMAAGIEDPLCVRTVMEVGALRLDEAAHLAALLLGSTSAEDPVPRQIATESQGNPYFVLELVRQHRSARGSLAGVDLDTAVWGRIQQLQPESRRLLEVVAVAGQPVQLQFVAEAAGMTVYDESILAKLRADLLVKTSGPGLSDTIETYHDRIRETVTARMPDEMRVSHHGRLASVLEAGEYADPEMIAIHFHEARQLEKASRYYIASADRAAETLAFQRAARLYRQALKSQSYGGAEESLLYKKLGDALANAGHGEEAAQAYQAAAGAAGTQGLQRLELQRDAAYQYLITGHFDEGRAAFRDVLAAAGMSMQRTPRSALASMLFRRLWLRLRGLRYRQRGLETIPPWQLGRLDTCWSVSIGLGVIDIIRAGDFQIRGLLMALKTGDPARIARSLALESIHNAAGGSFSSRRTRTLLDAAEQEARRAGDYYSAAVTRLARGATAWLEGRFRQSADAMHEAEQIFRTHCTGVTWEIDTAQTYRQFALANLGAFAELGTLAPALVHEAQQRGDLYASTNVKTYAMPLVLLGADQPQQAAHTVDEAMAKWSQHGFHAQHMLAIVSRSEIDLYRGEGMAAWNRLAGAWPDFVRSLMIRIQHPRIQLLYSRSRSALQGAARSRDEKLLRQAQRDARRLEAERREWSTALAHVIRGGLAVCRQERKDAIEHYRRAAELFDIVEAGLQAAAARRQLGIMLDADDLVQQADDWMKANGIQNPARMAQTLVPVPGLESGVESRLPDHR